MVNVGKYTSPMDAMGLGLGELLCRLPCKIPDSCMRSQLLQCLFFPCESS